MGPGGGGGPGRLPDCPLLHCRLPDGHRQVAYIGGGRTQAAFLFVFLCTSRCIHTVPYTRLNKINVFTTRFHMYKYVEFKMRLMRLYHEVKWESNKAKAVLSMDGLLGMQVRQSHRLGPGQQYQPPAPRIEGAGYRHSGTALRDETRHSRTVLRVQDTAQQDSFKGSKNGTVG
jgi:hypothetical protein